MDKFNNACESSGSVGTPITNVAGVTAGRMLDGEGRLICDPLCTDKVTQIRAAMEEITGAAPYVLVE